MLLLFMVILILQKFTELIFIQVKTYNSEINRVIVQSSRDLLFQPMDRERKCAERVLLLNHFFVDVMHVNRCDAYIPIARTCNMDSNQIQRKLKMQSPVGSSIPFEWEIFDAELVISWCPSQPLQDPRRPTNMIGYHYYIVFSKIYSKDSVL